MSLPEPKPGLVFRYDYLWEREARKGKGASKDRPACVAVATDSEIDPRLVVILPITHSKPTGETVGVEIPSDIRRYLRLDDERCWIIVSESNIDTWPSPGVTHLPGRTGEFVYGTLPRGLFATVKELMLRYLDLKRSVRR
jgi:hypothetical protein